MSVKTHGRFFLSVAIALGMMVALVGSTPRSGAADNDPGVDSRNGDRLGNRQVIVKDAFNPNRGQSSELHGRLPEPFNNGNRWVVNGGTWRVGHAFVTETSNIAWSANIDQRANVDSGLANVLVTATILRDRVPDQQPVIFVPQRVDFPDAITQFSGVTARFVTGVDWVGAWYDPFGWPANHNDPSQTCPGGQNRCGAVVLGAKNYGNPACPEGGSFCSFAELARYRFEWGDGKKHRLGLAVVDDQVTVLLNGRGILTRTFPQLSDATQVGVFSRGQGENRFESFEATGRVRIKTNLTPIKDDRGNQGNQTGYNNAGGIGKSKGRDD